MAETVIGFEFVGPVEEPEVGFRISQDCVFEAAQFSVPPPEFQTERVPLGFDPPTIALKGMDERSLAIFGVALPPVSVSVTETVCGELVAPEAEIVIVSI